MTETREQFEDGDAERDPADLVARIRLPKDAGLSRRVRGLLTEAANALGWRRIWITPSLRTIDAHDGEAIGHRKAVDYGRKRGRIEVYVIRLFDHTRGSLRPSRGRRDPKQSCTDIDPPPAREVDSKHKIWGVRHGGEHMAEPRPVFDR